MVRALTVGPSGAASQFSVVVPLTSLLALVALCRRFSAAHDFSGQVCRAISAQEAGCSRMATPPVVSDLSCGHGEYTVSCPVLTPIWTWPVQVVVTGGFTAITELPQAFLPVR